MPISGFCHEIGHIKRIANVLNDADWADRAANVRSIGSLLIKLDTIIFSDRPGKTLSQADYFSASYTQSIQKQLLISAAG
jgi:hypothetical protein